MTGPCKYVLKQVRFLSNNEIVELDYNHKANIISCVRIPNTHVSLKNYPGELSSIIKQLISDGYLEHVQFGFQLTHKGLHPYRVGWNAVKVFLIKSVLIPVIVSFVTSILTLWLKGQ